MKICAESVLLHPARREILFLLHAHPGLCFRELVKRTRIASGTMAHHLSVLRRCGQVWSMPLGCRILQFAAPKPDEHYLRRFVADNVLPELDQRVLTMLRTEGPCRQAAILDRFDAEPRSNVQHHLYRLRQLGFVHETRRGRYVQYEAMA
jgi:DNA-binding transcriptional ArsR family regulator